jgi:hypothetical protein
MPLMRLHRRCISLTRCAWHRKSPHFLPLSYADLWLLLTLASCRNDDGDELLMEPESCPLRCHYCRPPAAHVVEAPSVESLGNN